MIFAPPCEAGVFLRRYRRFFADVRCADGRELTVHCANTGSMLNCQVPGSPCWFSRSDDPKRKLPGTLELVTTGDGRRDLETLRAGTPQGLTLVGVQVIGGHQGANIRQLHTE